MNLYEYISTYRTNPNPAVAKSLGADERLVEYLKETPWNTSVNVVRGMCEGSTTQYRFHCTYGKISDNDGLLNYEIDKFNNIWNTIGNGKILSFRVENVITEDGTAIDFSFNPMDKVIQTYHNMIMIEQANPYQAFAFEAIPNNSQYAIDNQGFLALILQAYNKNKGTFDNIIASSADMVIEILDGYVIYITEAEEFNYYYFLLKNEQFINRYGTLTDGTNIYGNGDIITPTSDMVLRGYKPTITFYDENHNLMQNLSYVVTQESYYPCSNPMQVSSGEELRLPTGINNTPLHGTWYDDNNNSYEPGDYVSISSDTNFTFVQTVIQQEP